MFVQVNMWCSKELAQWLTELTQPYYWSKQLDDEAACIARSLQPAIIDNQENQFGSIMPKILKFFELPINSPFANDIRVNTDPLLDQINVQLEPYLDNEIGLSSRFKDVENTLLIPNLDVESQVYAFCYNFSSPYATTEVLKLLYKQLKNFNQTHCFMTHLIAYDEDFDTCYLSTSKTTPETLEDHNISGTLDIKQAWLGEVTKGYGVFDIELSHILGEHSLGDVLDVDNDLLGPDDLISTKEIRKLMDSDILTSKDIKKFEIKTGISWAVYLNGSLNFLVRDLFDLKAVAKTEVRFSNDIKFIEFDWDSNE